MGDSPPIIRLGRPRITRNPKDFDVCEELLWVKDINLADLAEGALHTDALRGWIKDTGEFWITNLAVQEYKAGFPVVRLTSKGWTETKPSYWSTRRAVSGDIANMNLGGFTYATRVYFSSSAALSQAYTVKSAPSIYASVGFGNGVISPVYATNWPYQFTGTTAGWFISSRDVERLPGSSSGTKITDVYSRFMNQDGTNGGG